MTGNEAAEWATYATPYVTAAAGTYTGAVLSRSSDKASAAMVAVGVRFLERVFGRREEGGPLPDELADLARDPEDQDALGAVRRKIRKALEQDTAMLEDVRSIIPEPPSRSVIQNVHAGRDAYTSARDMTIHQREPPA